MKLSNFFEDDKIECSNCDWSWGIKDTELKDRYVCHNCGHDNTKEYED